MFLANTSPSGRLRRGDGVCDPFVFLIEVVLKYSILIFLSTFFLGKKSYLFRTCYFIKSNRVVICRDVHI